MSISPDDIIQFNSGTANATGATMTLPVGTTDGNTLVACVSISGSASPLISGFTRDHGASAFTVRSMILRKSNVAAGETSWAITGPGSAMPIIWFIMEIQGIHKLTPVEAQIGSLSNGTGVTSLATQTTPASTAYETLAFAFHGAFNPTNSTVPVWSGHTGDFVEYAADSRVDGSTASAASVSIQVGMDVGTTACTATSSVSVNACSAVVIYAAATSRRQPNVDVMSGAEHGTTAGMATGNATNPIWDRVTGTPDVVTTSPRTGAYCYELSSTAAAENLAWTSTGALALYPAPTGFTARQHYCLRFSFFFPSSLPGIDVPLCGMDQGTGLSGSGVQIVYRTASQKIGVQLFAPTIGAGTEVLSATTVAADTWYSVDVMLDMANVDRGSEWHGYWSLDGVEQTTAVAATATASTVATILEVRLGWLTSITATVRLDDPVGSKHPGHYPLGDIGVYPLKVDPAGTLTISGTTGNFQTFTANGTMAAWNATTARGAVDDIPPTISASADGFAQITTAASDYVEAPMETRDAATNLQAPRAVRWYFPGWAASTTAAAIGFRAWDGTAETLLFAAADPNFDNSTTAPAWVCRMHRTLAVNTVYTWSQAKLDALAARVGFSTGATPDIGVHAVIAEVAMRAAVESQVAEQDDVFVYAGLDPDTGNVISLRLDSTTSSVDAWATYTISGSPVNRTADAGNGYEDLYVVGAETNDVVSGWTCGRT